MWSLMFSLAPYCGGDTFITPFRTQVKSNPGRFRPAPRRWPPREMVEDQRGDPIPLLDHRAQNTLSDTFSPKIAVQERIPGSAVRASGVDDWPIRAARHR